MSQPRTPDRNRIESWPSEKEVRGRGGATINLVAYHQVPEFAEAITSGYEAKTGRKLKTIVCQVADGVAT